VPTVVLLDSKGVVLLQEYHYHPQTNWHYRGAGPAAAHGWPRV